MESQDAAPGYHIWGVDKTAYGPVELPMLVNWIKDERVVADTWVFVERDDGWFKAPEIPELKMFFRPRYNLDFHGMGVCDSHVDLKPGALRRIKVLAEMTDDQLAALLQIIEIVRVPAFTHLIQRGDPSDAMYGVLEGELRSCMLVDGKECPLATLGPGSIFGEISMFDRGPRSADVISNQESVLVKLAFSAVEKLGREAPNAALALLLGLLRAVAGRVRSLTKRYEGSIQFIHKGDAVKAA